MAYKLLLADDSVTIQRVIELTFADEDIEVTTAGDGRQAIDCILRDRPDIVLADAGMPERDGFEVTAFVKGDPELRHIPVLLLTGAFEPVDEQRVRSVGCDGVLAKPFEPQLLIARVKELLSAAKRGRRAGDQEPAVTPMPPSAGDRSPERPWLRAQASPGWSADGDQTSEFPAALDGPPPGFAVQEPPAAMGPPAPASATLSRLDGIAMPGLAPAQEPGSPLSLDEYFDQLDAALATMLPSPEPGTGSPSGSAGEGRAGSQADLEWVQQIVRQRVDAGPVAGPEARPGPELQPASPVPPRPAVPLSAAFSAMLAAEQGEAVSPGSLGTVGVLPVPVDALVEEVTRRVVERLADRAVREQAAEIVSAVAERLVRDEIQRLKAKM